MSMGRAGIILASVVAALGPGASGAVAEFVCPLQQQGVGEVLPESPDKIEELSGLLGGGDLDNRLHLIIADLRRRYPRANDAEIVNYLVTAYCPLVDAEAIGDEEKTEKVNSFSGEVLRIVARQTPSP